jgi:hypothetical protein
MNIVLTNRSLLLVPESDFELTGLIVGAVAARDEFLVLATTSDGEPGLKIALSRRCVVYVMSVICKSTMLVL